MAVEGTPGHVSLDADLFDAGVLDTVLPEQPIGGILDPGAYLEFALFPSSKWCRSCVH
jgi:hypothetical protein